MVHGVRRACFVETGEEKGLDFVTRVPVVVVDLDRRRSAAGTGPGRGDTWLLRHVLPASIGLVDVFLRQLRLALSVATFVPS